MTITAALEDELRLLETDDLLGVREELALTGESTNTAGETIVWTEYSRPMSAVEAIADIDAELAIRAEREETVLPDGAIEMSSRGIPGVKALVAADGSMERTWADGTVSREPAVS